MRDWQLHNKPDRLELMIGKSHDSHGPTGPWIVTRDEIEDPHKLKLECFVNENLRQSSNDSKGKTWVSEYEITGMHPAAMLSRTRRDP